MENNTEFNPNLNRKLEKAREENVARSQVPPGYIEFRPSTRGLLQGCPPSLHCRNFTTEDLMNLGVADDNDRIQRLAQMLQSVIWEQDVRIELFHEKEVIEMLLFIYESFYQTVFPEQPWIMTDEDWNFIAGECGGKDTDEFKARERALKNGDWKPVFDIDISKDVQFYEIPDDFKYNVRINRIIGTDPFTCLFSIPRYGDVLQLKGFIESIFRDQDRRFASISETIKFQRDAEERWRRGENINLKSIPKVPAAEEAKLKDYETEKTLFAITSAKALHLIEFNGEDVSNIPLEKRIELAKDPRLDHASFKKVDDLFKELKFGIKEEIMARNPLTGIIAPVKYTFQLNPILAAFANQGPAQTTVSFE